MGTEAFPGLDQQNGGGSNHSPQPPTLKASSGRPSAFRKCFALRAECQDPQISLHTLESLPLSRGLDSVSIHALMKGATIASFDYDYDDYVSDGTQL